MNETLIERIKKLLRLATNNSSQGEMESAMAKAIEIATQNGIDIASLNINNQEKKKSEFIQDRIVVGQRLPITNDFVSSILRNHFRVNVVLGGNRQFGRVIYYVGTKEDIELAKYVGDFLSERFMSLWKGHYKQTNCGLAFRYSYFCGLYGGLDAKLTAKRRETENSISDSETANRYAVAVRNHKQELDLAMNQMFNNSLKTKSQTKKAVYSDAYHAGYRDGGQINICKGIET